MSVSTLAIMCDIIKEHMGLTCEQIWIYNQKRNIPTDSKLYVVLEYGGGSPYSSSKGHDFVAGVYKEIHYQKMQETIKINMLSADTEAVDRIGELIGALSSDYSQNIQSTQGLAISPKPANVIDASAAEVTRQLFRTIVEVKVLRAYKQEKTVPYYDKFNSQVSNEKGNNI
jgi:hypothetical protein